MGHASADSAVTGESYPKLLSAALADPVESEQSAGESNGTWLSGGRCPGPVRMLIGVGKLGADGVL